MRGGRGSFAGQLENGAGMLAGRGWGGGGSVPAVCACVCACLREAGGWVGGGGWGQAHCGGRMAHGMVVQLGDGACPSAGISVWLESQCGEFECGCVVGCVDTCCAEWLAQCLC